MVNKQEPVVQSIVSLTTSLRRHFVKYNADYIIKFTVIFCWKNVRIFCNAKAQLLVNSLNGPSRMFFPFAKFKT